MRIVVDLQGAQATSAGRGIGRYSLSLVRSLAQHRGSHDLVVALNGMLPDSVESVRSALNPWVAQSDIRVWEAVPPTYARSNENLWRIRTGECLREAFLKSLNPDVVLVTSMFEGLHSNALTSIGAYASDFPCAVVLYDLIPYTNPEMYLDNPHIKNWYLEKLAHLKRADLILAISEYTREQGIAHLQVPAERITNISAAAEDFFSPRELAVSELTALRTRYGVLKPFILSVGSYDFRKNVEGLIRAYSIIPDSIRQRYQLLLAGAIEPFFRSQVNREINSRNLAPGEVIIAESVPDDDLAALYSLCEFVVLPSFEEGFGLTALEAMKCGAPIIASNTSSLPEVVGNDEALFDPRSEHDISEKMLAVIQDQGLRNRLTAHGAARHKLFSWSNCATRTLEALEYVVKHRRTMPSFSKDATAGIVEQVISFDCSTCTSIDWELLAAAIDSNHPDSSETDRRLFVDVSELCQRDAKTGIQRVVRNILLCLLNSPPPGFRVEPVYATIEERGYRYARAFTAELTGDTRSSEPDEPIQARSNDIFLGLDLQWHVVPTQVDYLRRFRRHGVHVYFVVYDMIPVTHPTMFLPGWENAHCNWLRTIAQFDGAICISKTVANELSAWLHAHGPKRLRKFNIKSFPLGADFERTEQNGYQSEELDSVVRAIANRPAFLCVGTIEPRKGHAQVLEAFETLWSGGIDVALVIVGKEGWMVNDLTGRLNAHAERGKRLFWLDRVTDCGLDKLYRSATCLIAASVSEGFGLPLVEASRRALPLVVRNIPVFREISGSSAFYFSGDQPADLAGAIESWLEMYRRGIHPQSDGIKRYTWQDSSSLLIASLLECIDGKPVDRRLLPYSLSVKDHLRAAEEPEA